MASKFQEISQACEDCGDSSHPVYSVKANRKRLCENCVAKNPDVLLQETGAWTCDEHYDQRVFFFCETCRKDACTLCVCTSHKGHEFQPMEEVMEDLQKAKHERTSAGVDGNGSPAVALDFGKLLTECEREVDRYFQDLREEAKQKTDEATDRVKERHRRRKRQIDAEFDERIRKLDDIRNKRLMEEEDEQSKELTAIRRKKCQITAKVIVEHLDYTNYVRHIIDHIKKKEFTDNDEAEQLTLDDAENLKNAVVHSALHWETTDNPFSTIPHLLSSHDLPEDCDQSSTIYIAWKIILLFCNVMAFTFFLILADFIRWNYLFGCLSKIYLPIDMYFIDMCLCLSAFMICKCMESTPAEKPYRIFALLTNIGSFFHTPINLFFAYVLICCIHWDYFLGCRYEDYILIHQYYNHSPLVYYSIFIISFLLLEDVFGSFCNCWVRLFELILELSKRYEPELGMLGSKIVATSQYIISYHFNHNIQQRFNVQKCGLLAVMKPNSRRLWFIVRYVVGTIISVAHIRFYHGINRCIHPVHFYFPLFIQCLIAFINRPFVILLLYALIYWWPVNFEMGPVPCLPFVDACEYIVVFNGTHKIVLNDCRQHHGRNSL